MDDVVSQLRAPAPHALTPVQVAAVAESSFAAFADGERMRGRFAVGRAIELRSEIVRTVRGAAHPPPAPSVITMSGVPDREHFRIFFEIATNAVDPRRIAALVSPGRPCQPDARATERLRSRMLRPDSARARRRPHAGRRWPERRGRQASDRYRRPPGAHGRPGARLYQPAVHARGPSTRDRARPTPVVAKPGTTDCSARVTSLAAPVVTRTRPRQDPGNDHRSASQDARPGTCRAGVGAHHPRVRLRDEFGLATRWRGNGTR